MTSTATAVTLTSVGGPWIVGGVSYAYHSASLTQNVGMGYIPARLDAPGTKLSIDCRGKRVDAEVVRGPFYKRGKKT